MIYESVILALAFLPFDVDKQQSFIDGSFQQMIHMPGALIGDYDAETYPEGTMTRPGLWGGSGNNPIACSIEPIAGGPFADDLEGTLDIEFDFENSTMLISTVEFQALTDTTIQFPLSVIFEYETFRSISPDSLFIGGFPIEIPFGSGYVTRLDMSLMVSITAELIPVSSTQWSYQAELPIMMTMELEILETNTGPLPLPGVLFLDGTVTDEDGEISVTGTSSWKSQEVVADPPIFFDNLPLELPTIVPPGDFAGVYLSVAADESISTAIANFQFVAIGETNTNPNDINGDGVVNVSDLLEIISAWGSCNGCPADVNNDGMVNVTDILAVIGDWSVQ
jgi:hypothetical protein